MNRSGAYIPRVRRDYEHHHPIEPGGAVAAKAKAKGLLEPDKVASLIERELNLEEPLREYRQMVEKMRAYEDDEPMTMDEIQAEVNAVRAERQQRREIGP